MFYDYILSQMGANATTLSVLVLCSLHDFLMLSTTLFSLAHPAGFEPATIRLEGGCSIQLSYERKINSSRFNAMRRMLNSPRERDSSLPINA